MPEIRSLLFALMTTAAAGGLAHAAAIAQFTDGNGNTSADAYTGTAGNGWVGGYSNPLTNAPTVSNTVTNTAPLTADGGNYLSMNVTGSATTAASGQNVYRTFATGAGNVVTTQTIEIAFDFRLDSAASSRSTTDANDRITIFDNFSAGTGSTQTWAIGSQGNTNGGRWTFTNGDRAGGTTAVDTGLLPATGTVYHFDVLIYPGATAATTTWDASVTDGTNTFVQTGMAFRSTTATTSSTRIQFLSSVNSRSEVLGYSLDNLSVGNVPEPTALAGFALMGGLLGRRRRNV